MKKPIVVGGIKQHRSPPKSHFLYSYADVIFDEDDWADCNEYLPLEFDIVYVKTEENRIFQGWHIGDGWDGLKIRKDHVIKYWKRFC